MCMGIGAGGSDGAGMGLWGIGLHEEGGTKGAGVTGRDALQKPKNGNNSGMLEGMADIDAQMTVSGLAWWLGNSLPCAEGAA